MFPQNRQKLALKIYNWSLLDQLGHPLEYRIDKQLTARSAEVLFINDNDWDDWKPTNLQRRSIQHTSFPYELSYPNDDLIVGKVNTPEHGQFFLELDRYNVGPMTGALLQSNFGSMLKHWVMKRIPEKMEKQSRHSLANILVKKIQATQAIMITELLSDFRYSFVKCLTQTEKECLAFETLLQKIPRWEYFTIKFPAYHNDPQYKSAMNHFLVHKKDVKSIVSMITGEAK